MAQSALPQLPSILTNGICVASLWTCSPNARLLPNRQPVHLAYLGARQKPKSAIGSVEWEAFRLVLAASRVA
jgi:hypothetical protein